MQTIREILEAVRDLSEENAILKRENLFLQAQVSSLKKLGVIQKSREKRFTVENSKVIQMHPLRDNGNDRVKDNEEAYINTPNNQNNFATIQEKSNPCLKGFQKSKG